MTDKGAERFFADLDRIIDEHMRTEASERAKKVVQRVRETEEEAIRKRKEEE